MVTPKRIQLSSIRAGRGLAALLVVAFHGMGYFTDPRYWNKPEAFAILRGSQLGVDYFFVLSGAVILLAHVKDIGNPKTICTYLLKRGRRIYPIYWVFLTAVVLQYVLRRGLGAKYQTDPLVIFSGYLLVHIGGLQVNLPVAWTLFHEVLFYLVFAVMLYRRVLGIVAIAIWSLLSVVMAVHPGNEYCTKYLLAPVHLLFPLGMLVGWMIRKHIHRGSLFFAVAGFLIFGAAFLGIHIPGGPVGTDWVAGIGSALLIYGAAGLETNGHLSVSKPLQFLGDASYSIYLVHYPCLMFLAPLVYRKLHHSSRPLWPILLVLTAVATAAGCCLHLFVELPLLRCMGGKTVAASTDDSGGRLQQPKV